MRTPHCHLLKTLLVIALTSSLLVLVGCSDDDERIASLEQELNLEQTKLSLMLANDSVNLVTSVEESVTGHTIYLESGDSITTKPGVLTSITEFSDDWKIEFQFRDESTVRVGMVGTLTVESSNIKLNPYSRCPLCAVISLETPVKGQFKVIVHGKPGGGITMEKQFEKFSYTHEIPVLGLYADYLNQIELIFSDEHGNERVRTEFTIQTPSIPEASSLSIIIDNLPAHQSLYFSSDKPIGFDKKGEIRWYLTPGGDFQYIFPKLKNGNLLTTGSVGSYVYHSQRLFEITPLGQIVNQYIIPTYWHHDVVEMPNGNLLLLSNSSPIVFQDGVSEEETVVEIDRKTGQVVKVLDFRTILDPTRTPIPSTRPDDWVHLNAVEYQESDNSIIVSSRSQSVVAKIDYETGGIKWLLGDHQQWKDAYKPFLLSPVNAAGTPIDISTTDFWPSGQHSPRIKANGNLVLYDNGDHRYFYRDGLVGGVEYSRVVEYKINETAKTISLVNEFNYDKSLFTKYTGSATYIPSRNTVLAGFMFTSALFPLPKVVELDANYQTVFEANFSAAPNNYRALSIDMFENLNY